MVNIFKRSFFPAALHELGPLIGLPWEQENTGGRGEVELVYNSTFTEKGAYFLDGRQEEVYIIK